MFKLKVERLTPTAKIPTRGHYNDAGLDLYADETTTIKPGEHKYIKTSIKMAIPDGYVGLLWDKGGMGEKGLHILGGVYDSGYRGEIRANLVNLGTNEAKIEQGQKVTQILIQSVSLCEIEETKINDQTARGDGRHGSTGIY